MNGIKNQILLDKDLELISIIKKHINIILELGKVNITSFVAISSSLGFIVYSGNFSLKIILPTIGVFLLACGSSAFNHFQERETDAKMERTRSRPIPSGLITPFYAFITASILSLGGLALLYFSSNLSSMLLGIVALIWYNIIYTPLKKVNALAVVPGSIIGALPPMIGYAAAGGNPFDAQILVVALFFFIWQIPHFWLLLLIHNKDYEKAGFPTLTKKFSNSQLSRITFIWITALAVSGLLIPAFSISSNIFSLYTMLILGIWLIIETRGILTKYVERLVIRRAFLIINLYVLIITVIISIDKLLLTEI